MLPGEDGARGERERLREAMLRALANSLRGGLNRELGGGLPARIAHYVDELTEANSADDLALLVTNDPENWQDAGVLLREYRLRPIFRTSPAAAMRWLEHCAERARLLLVDMRTGGEEDGIEVSEAARAKWPWLRLAVATAFPDRWLGASRGITFLRRPILPLDVVKQAQEARKQEQAASGNKTT